MNEILEYELLDNTVRDLSIALLIFIGTWLCLWLFNRRVYGQLKKIVEKSPGQWDDTILELARKTLVPVIFVGAVYLGFRSLTLDPAVLTVVTAVTKVIIVVQIVRLIAALAILLLTNTWLKREDPAGIASKSILSVIRVFIWGIAVVFLLDNLGFDVNSVVAGLGIGGVAVALAAQTILGDLFNYFVIFFDKPFVEGDFIIVGDLMGTVEHIGIKTTRIRSLGGELVIISNTNISNSPLKNYKRMDRRRIVFKLGIIYQTPKELVGAIPEMIRAIIVSVPGTVFDRCHFASFGDFSLNFEAVYYVLSSDFNKYMDIQQAINLKILDKFESEGVEFAYPTQTEYVYDPNKVKPRP